MGLPALYFIQPCLENANAKSPMKYVTGKAKTKRVPFQLYAEE